MTIASLPGYGEPTIVIVIFFYTLTFKKCCNMKCWKYFFNGRGKATMREGWSFFLRLISYIIICEKSGYLETDIFHGHMQCAYIVPWTIVCKQLQSFSCWLEVVSLFHSIPFPENSIEREKRSESWANRKWRQYKTCSLFFCFSWLGVKRKKLVWIIGVVFRPNGLISIDNVF